MGFLNQVGGFPNTVRSPKKSPPPTSPIAPSRKKVLGVLVALVALYILFNSITIIEPGERGVVTWFGKPTKIMGEGFNFKAPIAESVHVYNVKTQKVETRASAASKDLQTVTSDIALNYHLAPGGTLWLHQNIGTHYKSNVIDPAIQESIKAATATFTAEELITQRPKVREKIKENLVNKMTDITKGNVIVDEFNIVDFQFSPEFNAAIEAKVTAEQQALKAERDLERIKIEAEQRVTRAKADADATLLQAQAQAEALRLQRQEVTSELNRFKAIEKWDGVLPKIVGGDKIPLILNTDESV